MTEEEKKKQQGAAANGEGGATGEGMSAVEKAKSDGEAMVEAIGGGGNSWKKEGGVATNVTETKNYTHNTSSSSTTQKKEFDKELYDKTKGAIDNFMQNDYESAYDYLYPQLKKEIDPAEIERKKKSADFRRNLHEVVSGLQTLSDIGTAFAGGNVYQREAPNMKQYQDEKDKVDKAREDAMKRLYEAKLTDMNFRNQMRKLGFENSYVNKSETNGEQFGTQTGTSNGVQVQSSKSAGFQPFSSMYETDNTGAGGTKMNDQVPIQLRMGPSNEPVGYRFVSKNAYNACASATYNHMAEQRINKKDDKSNDITKCFNYALNSLSSSEMLRTIYGDGKTKTDANEAYSRFRSIFEHGFYYDDLGKKVECYQDRLALVQYAMVHTAGGRAAFKTSAEAGELTQTTDGGETTIYGTPARFDELTGDK